MSNASNCARRCASAPATVSGMSGCPATWMSGSAWTKRASGATSRTASIARITARASCRFSSGPRPKLFGCMRAWSPPAQAQNEISLTGQ